MKFGLAPTTEIIFFIMELFGIYATLEAGRDYLIWRIFELKNKVISEL